MNIETPTKKQPRPLGVVVVPQERLNGCPVADVESIDGRKVLQYYKYGKLDIWPMGLFKLAAGMDVDCVEFWKQYRMSDFVYFFIVEL